MPDGKIIGLIEIEEHPTRFEVRRTATGVNLLIPATIGLEWSGFSEPEPMISGIRVTVLMKDASNLEVELCRMRDENSYLASRLKGKTKLELIWPNILPAIMFIEKNRADRLPELIYEVRGELCAINIIGGIDSRAMNRSEPLMRSARSMPLQDVHERLELTYQLDVWNKMVEAVIELSANDPWLMMQPLLPFLSGKSNSQ